MKKRPAERILLIRLSSIGDIVLTMPLIRRLRQRHPDARIDYLTKAKFSELLEANAAISQVLAFPDTGGLEALLRMRRLIRSNRYTHIIDLHKNLRSLVLTLGLFSVSIGRLRKYAFKRFLLVKFGKNFYKTIVPVYRRYIDAAGDLDLADHRFAPALALSAAAQRAATALLRGADLHPGAFIALAPGAGFATKRWPAEQFGRLAAMLHDEGFQVAVLGHADDAVLAARIQQSAPAAVNLAGRLRLMEAAAVLRQARCLITNDSGLLHIAEAVGTPVLAIFGGTVRELGFFPLLDRSRVLENLELRCRPCSHIGRSKCPRRHFLCMGTLTPEAALAVLRRGMLSGAVQPSSKEK